MSAPTSNTVVDWRNLHTWAGRLDSALRDRLADALRDIQCAEYERTMVDTVRAVLAREHPGRFALGVVFTTDSWENGYFLTRTGTVLFADGSTEDLEFDDIDEVFTDAIGVCGPDFGLSINVRTGDVDTDDNAEHLYAAFRPRQRRHPQALTADHGERRHALPEQVAA